MRDNLFRIHSGRIYCLPWIAWFVVSCHRKPKERIGIRKVNGASTFTLVMLLSNNFSKLILVAFLIAIPVAYYFGGLWLSNFAYKTSIGIELYIVAGVIALFLALATVSYHTFKAARSNPVESIRYE